MRHILAAIGLVLAISGASAQEVPKLVLITNVHVFDGVSEQRIENANVLVEGIRVIMKDGEIYKNTLE